MREASDILNTPAAMQIRYLETLKTMANEKNTKIIFMPPSVSGLDAGVQLQPQSSQSSSGGPPPKKGGSTGLNAMEKMAITQTIADM